VLDCHHQPIFAFNGRQTTQTIREESFLLDGLVCYAAMLFDHVLHVFPSRFNVFHLPCKPPWWGAHLSCNHINWTNNTLAFGRQSFPRMGEIVLSTGIAVVEG